MLEDIKNNSDSFTMYNQVKEDVKITYTKNKNNLEKIIKSEFELKNNKVIGFDTIFLTKMIELKNLDLSKMDTKKSTLDNLEIIKNSNMTEAEKEHMRKNIIFNSIWTYNDNPLHVGIERINGGNLIKINFSSKDFNKYGLIKDLSEIHEILSKALKNLFNYDLDLNSFKVSRLDISADIQTKNSYLKLFNLLNSLKIPRLDHENHGSDTSQSIYYKNGSEHFYIYDKTLEAKEKNNLKLPKNIIRLERSRRKNVSYAYGVKTFGELIEYQENVKEEFELWLKDIYKDNKHTFIVKKDIQSIIKNYSNLSDKDFKAISALKNILDIGIRNYLNSRPRSTRGNSKRMIERDLKKYNKYFDKQNELIRDIEKIFL